MDSSESPYTHFQIETEESKSAMNKFKCIRINRIYKNHEIELCVCAKGNRWNINGQKQTAQQKNGQTKEEAKAKAEADL